MRQLLLNTCVAGACALAFVAAYGPAKAVSPLSLGEDATLVVPVQDQENLSVEEDLRPDVPPSDFGTDAPEEPKNAPQKEVEGKGSGDIEDEMVDKLIGPE
jgi:hypothetical protein